MAAAKQQTPARSPGRIYTLTTLHEKGIPYHDNYIRRLVAKGEFPAPFYMSRRRPAWTEAALDAWIASREAARVAKVR